MWRGYSRNFMSQIHDDLVWIHIKFDSHSHGNFFSFCVTSWWKFGQNPHQIPWRFYVIYPGLIYLPCSNMKWILEKFVMEFPSHLLRAWWDFHPIWCHWWPNCRQKDMRNPWYIFYRAVENPWSMKHEVHADGIY